MTLTGATEAHILAKEIGEAGIGVILNPVRPFPYVWDSRRMYVKSSIRVTVISRLLIFSDVYHSLPGPPLTQDSAVVHLMEHNVTVGMGVMGINQSPTISVWSARNARFDVSWVGRLAPIHVDFVTQLSARQ